MLAILVAACTTAAPAPPAPTTTSTSTPAPTSTAPTTTTTEPRDQLQSVLDRFDDTPVRIVYRISDGTESAEVVVARDPGATPPAEAITLVEVGITLITLGDTALLCDAGSQRCTPLDGHGPGVGQLLSGPITLLVDPMPTQPVPVSTDSDLIADRAATCVPVAEALASRICFDDLTGAVLLVERLGTDGTPMVVAEAMKVEAPLGSDFEPPWPIAARP